MPTATTATDPTRRTPTRTSATGTSPTRRNLTTSPPPASGRAVRYTDLPVEQYAQVLVSAGLPEPVAAVYADGDRGVADGELLVDPADLEKLIRRPATPLVVAAETALRAV